MLKKNYFSQSVLLARPGWSKAMVRLFGLVPDCVTENNFCKTSYPTKLFLKKRILALEETRLFKDNLALIESRKEKRRSRAPKGLKSKSASAIIVERVENIETLALQSFLAKDSDLSPTEIAPDFLAEICVNYIRQELTSFEKEKGHLLDLDICLILDEIARVYPEFAKECTRQKFLARLLP